MYDDDIVLTGLNNTSVRNIIDKFGKEFTIRELGNLWYFLDIQVRRYKEGIFLFQQQYVVNLLNNTLLTNLKLAKTPMATNVDLISPIEACLDEWEYRRLAGSLQDLTLTWPDIMHAISKVAHIMETPKMYH